MCLGGPPKPPPLPTPRPTAPAPERTAKTVVTGKQRKKTSATQTSSSEGLFPQIFEKIYQQDRLYRSRIG